LLLTARFTTTIEPNEFSCPMLTILVLPRNKIGHDIHSCSLVQVPGETGMVMLCESEVKTFGNRH
jgi:hypothetical protein